MRIGVAGPILVDPLREFLDGSEHGSSKPPGGMGGTPVVHLVREFIRRGRQIVVFTLDPTVTEKVVLGGDRLRILIGPYRNRARERAMDGFRAERAFIGQAIRGEKVDVVHAHWTYEFALGALESGHPVLVTAHDAPFSVLRYMPDGYRLIRLAMAMVVARRTRYMTAVSPYVHRHWRSRLFYRKDMKMVPNGLPRWIFDLGKENVVRPSGRLTFSSVLSGWGKLKNAMTLLKAFRLVRHDLPEAKLILFGPGFGPGEQAEGWARGERLGDGIEFAGRLPFDTLLSRLSSDTDVFVLPSREEACPMAVIEALALRLPVIGGARSGGLPYTLDQGRAGMLCDVSSPRPLADTMIRLGRDENLRARLADSGYQYARDYFSIEKVASSYEEAYLGALGNP